MSNAQLPPRPRQLMLAAGVVIGGSAILLAAVFDALGNLESVDTRAQMEKVVTSSAGRDLGVTLDQALGAVRAALSVTAVCAAIAVVLGIFVLQRHRGARVALSVVAVPLLVTAPLVGGFLGALVAVATVMLWNGAAGDWYAGRPIRSPSVPPGREQGPPSTRDGSVPPGFDAPPAQPRQPSEPALTGAPSTRQTSTAPQATDNFGTVAQAPPAAPPQPYAWPEAPPVGRQAGVARPAERPVPVRVACLLTWVFSGSVALLYLLAVFALVLDRSAIVDRVVASPAWHDSGLRQSMLMPMLWFGVVLFLLWSIGAMVLAWFTWRHHDWARYLLAVSAGVALLIAAVGFPIGIVHQLACAGTIWCLFAPTTRAWFSSRGRPPSGPQAGPPPGYPQAPPPGQRPGPW